MYFKLDANVLPKYDWLVFSKEQEERFSDLHNRIDELTEAEKKEYDELFAFADDEKNVNLDKKPWYMSL